MGSKSHADTSWVIALLNPDDAHHKKALTELEELNAPASLSSFSLAELLVSFDKSDVANIKSALTQIKQAFSDIIDINQDIAVRAAEIRANNRVTLGEAIVIATALEERSRLLTFDKSMRTTYERIK